MLSNQQSKPILKFSEADIALFVDRNKDKMVQLYTKKATDENTDILRSNFTDFLRAMASYGLRHQHNPLVVQCTTQGEIASAILSYSDGNKNYPDPFARFIQNGVWPLDRGVGEAPEAISVDDVRMFQQRVMIAPNTPAVIAVTDTVVTALHATVFVTRAPYTSACVERDLCFTEVTNNTAHVIEHATFDTAAPNYNCLDVAYANSLAGNIIESILNDGSEQDISPLGLYIITAAFLLRQFSKMTEHAQIVKNIDVRPVRFICSDLGETNITGRMRAMQPRSVSLDSVITNDGSVAVYCKHC